MSLNKAKINLIHTKKCSVFFQLQLEEALLRATNENWCLINEGCLPAIVIGSSGNPDELINQEKLKQQPIPVIKRFTGGGCVVVDPNTIFVTIIMNEKDVTFNSYPEPIMRWIEALYKPVLVPHDFKLIENDYVIENKKCMGNAQYIQKQRWLHHSTLLWDYDEKLMDYLLLPKQRPQYRQDRSHVYFLCKLKDYVANKEQFIFQFISQIGNHYEILLKDINEMDVFKKRAYRKETVQI